LQARGSRLASLGGQFIFIFGRKRKGFINKGKRNFLIIYLWRTKTSKLKSKLM